MQNETGYTSKFAHGISSYAVISKFKSDFLVTDVWVKPHIGNEMIEVIVEIDYFPEEEGQTREIVKDGIFSPFNSNDEFEYTVPDSERVLLKKGQNLIRNWYSWEKPGKESWWWPNRPFREDYTPTLHWYNLTFNNDFQVSTRFGFVEHSENSDESCYLINGRRFNYIGDGTPEPGNSEYDAYTNQEVSDRSER